MTMVVEWPPAAWMGVVGPDGRTTNPVRMSSSGDTIDMDALECDVELSEFYGRLPDGVLEDEEGDDDE